ncbi:hypothetical protein CCC_04140 [Paramagnetospirillum magnetotacticum MS-1]|uniref:Uncharacterized protein n=1 Tax=Paramagnetospirillum magnetotacticum MS-1 TaxID=272627 RepID=A0A0C2YHZ4_PARME|nr:hypothetical protein CCC_04140 [Paramagnetospirillum magnetotacticum MS-1]
MLRYRITKFGTDLISMTPSVSLDLSPRLENQIVIRQSLSSIRLWCIND